MTNYTIDPKRVPLSVAKGLDHGWEAEKGHLCDSRRAVLLSVSRQKCWPAHIKHNERSKRVFGGGGAELCGGPLHSRPSSVLVRSASGSPLLLRKSLNANESQISLMGRVPPYLGRPGTQVPGWQQAPTVA